MGLDAIVIIGVSIVFILGVIVMLLFQNNSKPKSRAPKKETGKGAQRKTPPSREDKKRPPPEERSPVAAKTKRSKVEEEPQEEKPVEKKPVEKKPVEKKSEVKPSPPATKKEAPKTEARKEAKPEPKAKSEPKQNVAKKEQPKQQQKQTKSQAQQMASISDSEAEKKKKKNRKKRKVGGTQEEEVAFALEFDSKQHNTFAKKEDLIREEEEDDNMGVDWSWSHVNSRVKEIDSLKSQLAQSSTQVSELQKALADNVAKLKAKTTAYTEVVKVAKTEKQKLETKIRKLEMIVNAREAGEEVSASGDALRERNYVVAGNLQRVKTLESDLLEKTEENKELRNQVHVLTASLAKLQS